MRRAFGRLAFCLAVPAQPRDIEVSANQFGMLLSLGGRDGCVAHSLLRQQDRLAARDGSITCCWPLVALLIISAVL